MLRLSSSTRRFYQGIYSAVWSLPVCVLGWHLLPFGHCTHVLGKWRSPYYFRLLSVSCGQAGTGAWAQGVAWPSPFFPEACASLTAWHGGLHRLAKWDGQTQGCTGNAELHGIMWNIIYSLNAENLPFLPPRQQTNPCPVMTKPLPFYYFSIGFRCSVSVPYRLAWWLRAPGSLRTFS